MSPEKKSKPGWGERLEARFRPSAHWGAEFLADGVRLCALAEVDGKVTVIHSFQGGFPEAEAFATTHGLASEGFHASVSHVPFKIEALGGNSRGAEGSEEDPAAYLDQFRPHGLPGETFESHFLFQGNERLLVLGRESAFKAFRENLPAPLQSLWSLGAGPLPLLPFLESTGGPNRWAAIWAEARYSHLLIFRNGALAAYAKVFSGWEDASEDPVLFAREMKKALVYHYASRFPDAALEAVHVWYGGPESEAASALSPLGISQVTPDWSEPLQSLPGEMRVAGALGLQALRGSDSQFSFSLPPPEGAESHRKWLGKAGQLARVGSYMIGLMAAGVVVLGLCASGLHWAVEAKSRTWSQELGKWDEFQKSKAAVEKEMGGMEGLLVRRSESYVGIQEIAKLVPPEVWLESWELESGRGKGISHMLKGLSLSESHIPEFLANLEKSGRFSVVKLKSTERIKGETVELKTGIAANHRDIVQFQIGVTQ
ncbi:MAG: PilN domain-containing protein [Fibrobacterota bacterium]|nr:PilN domain-containing protein [Fibrobacterota bacterium]